MRWFAFVLLLLLAALYSGLPYYFEHSGPKADVSHFACPPGRPGDPDSKDYGARSPVIKIIDLTDRGELVDRCQWTDALYELVRVQREKVVLLYVHGWKHNSDPKDTDLTSFTSFVEKYATEEPARHVVGIYVGWDASTQPTWLENLTFWGRQRAADRISQSSTLTKLIGAIDSIRHIQAYGRARAQNVEAVKLDPIIAIGHSFGARILFTATSQLLLYKVQMAYPTSLDDTYEVIRGPVDMIVLINPALEASAYTALDSVRRNKEDFSPRQLPLLMSIATGGDWATKLAFPAGQWIGLARTQRELTTLGNYSAYSTHQLMSGKTAQATTRSDTADEYCQSGICLVRKSQPDVDRQQRNNPFLVVDADLDVLEDHSAIWKAPFVEWMAALFRRIDRNRPDARMSGNLAQAVEFLVC